MINESTLEAIRARANIVDVARAAGVGLQKASGGEWRCRCPFHTEKTPSCNLNPKKGVFNCFGCGEKGDVFALSAKLHGLAFPDAVRAVADISGCSMLLPDSAATAIRVPQRPPARRVPDVRSGPSPEQLAIRARVYRFTIETIANGRKGADALSALGQAFLQGRAIDPEISGYYGFRSIDNKKQWHRLGEVLRDQFTVDDLLVAGFYNNERDGEPCEPFFRMPFRGAPALLIPYWKGDDFALVRFRRMDGATAGPKYDTPRGVETIVPFNAAVALRKLSGDVLHVVEGELNAWTLHLKDLRAIGIPGVSHWRAEWEAAIRPARRVLWWYDNDEAGRRAIHGYTASSGAHRDGLIDKLDPRWWNRTCGVVNLPAGRDANAMNIDGTLGPLIEEMSHKEPIR